MLNKKKVQYTYMDYYMYKYVCKKWYGQVKDVRHLAVKDQTPINQVKQNMIENSKKLSGSGTCNVFLLQKFHLEVKPLESYPSFTSISFDDR